MSASRLQEIYQRAVAAVHPSVLLQGCLRLEGDHLHIGPHRLPAQAVWLAGAGKAALAMAAPFPALLGQRFKGGLVAVADGCPHCEQGIEVLVGGHPLPDQRSLLAGEALLEFLRQIPAGDSLIFVLSGGASSLIEAPRAGLDLSQILHLNRLLLASGAPIEDINRIRPAFSRIKGGGLRSLLPEHNLTLVMSDVGDQPLALVGSGPTLGMGSAPETVRELLSRHAIELNWQVELPVAALPVEGKAPYLLADVHTLIEAARNAAQDLTVRSYPQLIVGEARRTAVELADFVESMAPGLLVAGGETTVNLRGPGRGGRCQELALAFAVAAEHGLAGKHWTLLAAGSDGRDGPTDAAGAWVDWQTMAKARQLGLDVSQSLANNDSYPCLEKLGQLVEQRSTGTNLNDLILILLA